MAQLQGEPIEVQHICYIKIRANMNTKKKTMTLISIYMLDSNFKLHSSFNITASTLDNLADTGCK